MISPHARASVTLAFYLSELAKLIPNLQTSICVPSQLWPQAFSVLSSLRLLMLLSSPRTLSQTLSRKTISSSQNVSYLVPVCFATSANVPSSLCSMCPLIPITLFLLTLAFSFSHGGKFAPPRHLTLYISLIQNPVDTAKPLPQSTKRPQLH